MEEGLLVSSRMLGDHLCRCGDATSHCTVTACLPRNSPGGHLICGATYKGHRSMGPWICGLGNASVH